MDIFLERPDLDALINGCEKHILPSIYIEEILSILKCVRDSREANEKGPKYMGKCDGCERGRRLRAQGKKER